MMVVCIWFPQWPLQHAVQQRSELKGRLVVLHSPLTGRTARVVECSAAAGRRGVRVGMPLVEARALLENTNPPAFLLPHDPVADRIALEKLAICCEEYTPLYGIEEAAFPECLLLDVTGCADLFGGEQVLAQRIHDAFCERGWQVRIAIGPTIGAAWALSHRLSRPNLPVVVPADRFEESLDTLPVSALRLPDAMVHTLSELGIHGVGQLRRLPRNRLPARFGPLILRRLDQALGHAAELLVAERPTEPIAASWATQEPIRDRRVLLEICRRLLERILPPLQSQRRGIRRMLCRWHGGGGRPCEVVVGMVSPCHSVAQIQELLELQFERIAWRDDITFVRLEAVEVSPLEERPRDLFGELDSESHSRALRWLLERLSNRLGADAVVRAAWIPDPQPEFAVAYQPWIANDRPAAREHRPEPFPNAAVCSMLRPLRLFTPPQRIVLDFDQSSLPHRFLWGQAEYYVRQAWGPERIQTGWWRGNHVCRDYYRVEVLSGERYWLFCANDHWFLHGTFD